MILLYAEKCCHLVSACIVSLICGTYVFVILCIYLFIVVAVFLLLTVEQSRSSEVRQETDVAGYRGSV